MDMCHRNESPESLGCLCVIKQEEVGVIKIGNFQGQGLDVEGAAYVLARVYFKP